MNIFKKIARALTSQAARENKKYYTSAIIVAAGKSTRTSGNLPKQLVPIKGIPVVVRTMLAFEKCPLINEIIVVASHEQIKEYENFRREYGIKKLSAVTVGGETRSDSVEAGFRAVSSKCEFVAIHDGARCLIKPEDIERVVKSAFRYGAAIIASRSTDTLKKVDEKGVITDTVDRKSVMRAQTPQVFMKEVGIIILSELIDKDPVSLLAGLGASAAVLMLIFKDTIMGFVSGVQLSANDMLKVGDWIKVPKYDADGVVTEVTLNTVKVRNWDNTVTTVPPYVLVSDSFQNWNAMRESGGRRIKRSVNIDMSSVKFCTPEMLERFRKISLLKDYIERKEQDLQDYNAAHSIDNTVKVNGRRQTNLGVFRAYLTAYLRSLPYTNQELHCMVRHLQPTDRGIPVELYFFSTVKDWIPYEEIQADVFDHVLAVIPEFDLRVFQSPSGADVQRMAWQEKN